MNSPQGPTSPKNNSRSSISCFCELPYVKLHRKWSCLEKGISRTKKNDVNLQHCNASIKYWQISGWDKNVLHIVYSENYRWPEQKKKVPYVQKQQQASLLGHETQAKLWVDLQDENISCKKSKYLPWAQAQITHSHRQVRHTQHYQLPTASNACRMIRPSENYKCLQKSREPTHSAVLAFHNRTSLSRLPLASTSELAGWKRTYKNEHHLKQISGRQSTRTILVLYIIGWMSCMGHHKLEWWWQTLRASKTATLKVIYSCFWRA